MDKNDIGLENWRSKTMNGQHLRQTEEDAAKETWLWMTRGTLKRETESLIVAAEDEASEQTNEKRR